MNSKNQCLLILGESKIGKSTILKKIINNLRSREYSVGGFITKPKKLHKNEFGFEITDLTTLNQVYYASNNFNIGPKVDQVRVSINELSEFCKNKLYPAISVSDVFILDKISKMELCSSSIKEYIYNLISIPKPVIGVIDFFIHDKVLDQFRKSVSNVIEVTIENRDTLPDEITEIIIKECNK